jgi:hypothetical protein
MDKHFFLDITKCVHFSGNVNFLKGFQVRQFGNSYDNFLKKMCSVIDLSDMTASDLILLMKVITFSIVITL